MIMMNEDRGLLHYPLHISTPVLPNDPDIYSILFLPLFLLLFHYSGSYSMLKTYTTLKDVDNT